MNQREAVSKIAAQEPFSSGNLTGGAPRLFLTGMLPGEWVRIWQSHRRGQGGIQYVVWSYSTPIMWVAAGHVWFPDVRYSQTTGQHQSRVADALRSALSGDSTVVRDASHAPASAA